jgi:hypothetical protein
MKRLPCPSCKGTRFQVADPPVEGQPFAMQLCEHCRGIGVVYVKVTSLVEALLLRARLAADRVLAILRTFIG